MKKEFTASTYIFDGAKVLLVLHKKLKKWLPVGGHVEPNETPEEAAKREAKEEAGIDIELIPQENITVHHPNARSFARPYLCLLQEIPPFGSQDHHQHIDFVFIAKPKEDGTLEAPQEVVRWFTLEEINTLLPEELFLETKEILNHLFDTVLC